MAFQVFFTDKFLRDRALNNLWFDYLEEREDVLTPDQHLIASKLLNSHHIWNCRLKQVVPESELSDRMPLAHWKRLQQANTRETIAYLDDLSAGEKVRYHDSEGVALEQLTIDLLFQLLQDNAAYRGQLALLCGEDVGLRML